MPNSKKTVKNYFYNRFAVKKDFWEPFETHKKGKSIWVTSNSLIHDENFVASGIRALRTKSINPKPTTYILQFLNSEIKKNTVDLTKEELKTMVFDRNYIESNLSTGYIALKYQDKVIGCGLKDSKGLRTQIPKGKSKELEEIIL